MACCPLHTSVAVLLLFFQLPTIVSLKTTSDQQQQQHPLPPLRLNHYSRYFGGDSRGIPSQCNANNLINDILQTDESTGEFSHPSYFTKSSILNALVDGGVELPAHILHQFNYTEDGPWNGYSINNQLPPMISQYTIFTSIQKLQCLLTTCTASLSSLSYCQFSLNDVYIHVMLLAHLSALAKEHYYAELMAEDAVGVLGMMLMAENDNNNSNNDDNKCGNLTINFEGLEVNLTSFGQGTSMETEIIYSLG